MATTAEKQALGYLLLLALIGAGVQAVGAARFDREALAAVGAPGAAEGDAGAAALSRQRAAVDSARVAGARGRDRQRGQRRPRGRRGADAPAVTPAEVGRGPGGPPARRPPGPIDVNAATAAELERLPRIGPALARRIVAWREQHGPFAGPDDLRHVRGIGRSTVLLLLPHVTFSGRHRPLLSEGPPGDGILDVFG